MAGMKGVTPSGSQPIHQPIAPDTSQQPHGMPGVRSGGGPKDRYDKPGDDSPGQVQKPASDLQKAINLSAIDYGQISTLLGGLDDNAELPKSVQSEIKNWSSQLKPLLKSIGGSDGGVTSQIGSALQAMLDAMPNMSAKYARNMGQEICGLMQTLGTKGGNLRITMAVANAALSLLMAQFYERSKADGKVNQSALADLKKVAAQFLGLVKTQAKAAKGLSSANKKTILDLAASEDNKNSLLYAINKLGSGKTVAEVLAETQGKKIATFATKILGAANAIQTSLKAMNTAGSDLKGNLDTSFENAMYGVSSGLTNVMNKSLSEIEKSDATSQDMGNAVDAFDGTITKSLRAIFQSFGNKLTKHQRQLLFYSFKNIGYQVQSLHTLTKAGDLSKVMKAINSEVSQIGSFVDDPSSILSLVANNGAAIVSAMAPKTGEKAEDWAFQSDPAQFQDSAHWALVQIQASVMHSADMPDAKKKSILDYIDTMMKTLEQMPTSGAGDKAASAAKAISKQMETLLAKIPQDPSKGKPTADSGDTSSKK